MRPAIVVSTALLLPAVIWLVTGVSGFLQNGFYGYSSLFPFPFRMHTLSLLNVSIFYLAAFLFVGLHEPMKSFLITFSLLFLSNAVYEFAFAVFYDWRGMLVALPLVIGGVVLVLLLNRKYRSLASDRGKVSLALLGLSCFFLLMLTLNQSGFFEQVRFYLSGQTATDPHNPLWVLSKAASLWMLFPLLRRS